MNHSDQYTKPVLDRSSSPRPGRALSPWKPTSKQPKESSETHRYKNYNPEKEPIKAYLRIRPKPVNYQTIEQEPYLEIIDDVEVSMTPPPSSNAYRTRQRAPDKYKFSRVFRDTTDQETFFKETSMELVKDVLEGNNALIFAYGVTNSGKTHTVTGKQDSVGLLPRALDMIFNGIEEHKSEAKIKPCMHSSLQLYQDEAEENRHVFNSCNMQTLKSVHRHTTSVDPGYQYGIWVSFIEVYNEQTYDLLDTNIRQVKRKQLNLKYEPKSGNKYVADMNLVKVKSIQEANAILEFGQQNRQVFSTLMNQTSSRSHSIFTIHVIKCPINDDHAVIEDPKYATLSKLSIVDLAGSERYKNTNNSGQRLKEAGNINKSLMVLGQCMEVLRANQLRTDMGKAPSIVPFRHSKLTELFKSTFEGDGKAVIIVNVNPFDTGFDENSHVMKFAAVAKDVTTWRQTKPKLDLSQAEFHVKRLRLDSPADSVMMYTSDGEEDKSTYLVDNLIEEIDELNSKWLAAETRANNAEAEARAQLCKENEFEFRKLEDLYLQSMKREIETMKTDAIRLCDEQQATDTGSDTFHSTQHDLMEAISMLQKRLEAYDINKQYLLDQVSKLEIENEKERRNNQILMAKLQSNVSPSVSNKSSLHTEDEDDDDLLKENHDPTPQASFDKFLSLRKQLRRSIFKREELCKDADIIMNQVEQFDGVTFKLAKETNMGKLLKLIVDEEFEKDPYGVRNRAKRLLKLYAQLPTTDEGSSKQTEASLESHQPPRKEFSTISLSSEHDEIDVQKLQAENIRLKQKIVSLNKGQHRLKEAFERNRVLCQNHTGEDAYMIDSSDLTKSSSSYKQEEEQSQHITHEEPTIATGNDDEYESDISTLLEQKLRHKRRRKLRSVP